MRRQAAIRHQAVATFRAVPNDRRATPALLLPAAAV
jgi:hypothetical protein